MSDDRQVPSGVSLRWYVAVGIANLVGVTAVYVHLRRAWTAWEPTVGLVDRCLIAVGLIGFGLLVRSAVRREDQSDSSLWAAMGIPILFVVGLVPAEENAETFAWIAGASVVGVLVAGRESIDTREVNDALVTEREPSNVATELSVFDAEPEPDHSAFVATAERSLVDGYDTATGRTRVTFVAGQRIATLHVPFVPAFPAPPECEVELDDGGGSAQVTVVRAFGTRIEVRRPDVTDDDVVTVHWSAWSPAA